MAAERLMGFDAREATAKVSEIYPPFDFIGLDGETYHLASIATVGSVDLARLMQMFDDANSDDDDIDDAAMFETAIDILTSCAVDEASANAVRALSPLVLGQLVHAWQSTDDELGKSDAESSAIEEPPKQPKRTRKAAAKTSGRSKPTKSARSRKSS